MVEMSSHKEIDTLTLFVSVGLAHCLLDAEADDAKAALASVCAIVVVGCGGGGSTSTPSAPIATPTPQATRAEVTLTVSPPTLVAR